MAKLGGLVPPHFSFDMKTPSDLIYKVAKMPKLSICIPAYDMGGHGAQFLAESFERLKQQSFRDFEVVVSDQSKDEAVQVVCDTVEGITVHHVWFREGPKQASANANNAMRHANGEILKILFQDDLLLGPNSLETMMTGFEDRDVAWSVCGSGGTRDGQSVESPMVPSLHPYMHLGKNRISSPSVLAMRRSKAMDFDEQLIWLMDVDLYHRLLLAYGPPLIVPETLVLNRLHDGQVSAGVTSELKRTELRYARQKFKEQETLKQSLFYYKQMLRG
jgi:Glycosyl transferase family 2